MAETRFALAEGLLRTKLKTVSYCPNCLKKRLGIENLLVMESLCKRQDDNLYVGALHVRL